MGWLTRLGRIAELVQEGNSRKEPVKGHYETLICQGLTKINDSSLHRLVFTRSSLLFPKASSLINFKLIGIPTMATAAPNFETRLDRFVLHRLPQYLAAFVFDHRLVDALTSRRLSTHMIAFIESFDQRTDLTDRIRSLWLLIQVVRIRVNIIPLACASYLFGYEFELFASHGLLNYSEPETSVWLLLP